MSIWSKPQRKPVIQPRVWALRCPLTGVWSKAVVYERPSVQPGYEWTRVGPFRSEIDAEEFCDRNNRALVTHTAVLYQGPSVQPLVSDK
jgi:hypothetical protein